MGRGSPPLATMSPWGALSPGMLVAPAVAVGVEPQEHRAAIVKQRCFAARRELEARCAVLLQQRWRGFRQGPITLPYLVLWIKVLKRKERPVVCATQLQAKFRGLLGRMKAKGVRRVRAAAQIQRQWRGWVTYQQFRKIMKMCFAGQRIARWYVEER